MFLLLLNYRLDVYIHDYLVKRDLKASKQAFQAEGKVSSNPVGEYIRTRCWDAKTSFISERLFFLHLFLTFLIGLHFWNMGYSY